MDYDLETRKEYKYLQTSFKSTESDTILSLPTPPPQNFIDKCLKLIS